MSQPHASSLLMPTGIPRNIHDVRLFERRGPWRSKSGGALNVSLVLNRAEMLDFYKYDTGELRRLPSDIRGVRIYSVSGIPEGGVSGKEFHRVRKEYITSLRGSIELTVADIFGQSRQCVVGEGSTVYIPPYIMHTHVAQHADTSVVVLANTIFDPDDARTHDTYSMEEFTALQERYVR